MNRFRHSLAALAAVTACATAFTAEAQYGRSVYNFLDIPTSAHAFALGGTNVSVIDDDIAHRPEPRALGPEIDTQLGFSYMMHMQTVNFASVRYGMVSGRTRRMGRRNPLPTTEASHRPNPTAP